MENAADNLNVSSDAVAVPGGDFLIWQPSVFMAISEQIEAVGKRDCPVIINGETGTAKETLARQIHLHSPRAKNPFIPINCGILHGNILLSQLFGQLSSSPDGKQTISLGSFRAADGGTIFLDEIDKLKADTQAKVLHVIQHRSVQPQGSTETFSVNARVICATDRNLRQLIQDGRFIPELYFRLNIATLELPPLRQRPDDILILANYFLDLHARMYSEPAKELDSSVIDSLTAYNWPGNVRELAGVMERAFVMSKTNKITANDLPNEILAPNILEAEVKNEFPSLDDVDRKVVMRALEKTRGQKMAAAKLLRIDHRKLNRLIRKFDLEPSAFKEEQ